MAAGRWAWMAVLISYSHYACVAGPLSPFSIEPARQQYIVQDAAGICGEIFGNLDGLALGGGGGATFDEPGALSVTKSDSVATHGVVIADRRNSRIRKLEKGYVRSISGSNFAYADGVGTSAKYRYPSDISISPDGNWAAIIDNGDFTKVRRLDLASGAVSTIAGVGVGLADGPASEAKFSNVVSGIRGNGLAVSPDGTWIAVADTENHAIRRVDVASRITSTLVGIEICTMTGTPPTCERAGSMGVGGFADGFATQRLKNDVVSVCSTGSSAQADQVEIVDDMDGKKTRLTLTVFHKGELSSEINAEREIFRQKSVSFETDIAAKLSVVASKIKIECSSSTPSDCNGSPPLLRLGNATVVLVVISGLEPARLKKPTRLEFSTNGDFLVISDTGNHAIRKLDVRSMILTTLAGIGASPEGRVGKAGMQDGAAMNAVLTSPGGLALSLDDRILLVAEPLSHSIRRLDLQTGLITTLAGNGTASAINGMASKSTFNAPNDVSFGSGDRWVAVADTGNNCIRNLTFIIPGSQGPTPPPAYSNVLIASASGYTGPVPWHRAASLLFLLLLPPPLRV